MINITILGAAHEAPSNASDTNWVAKQVALEQALAAGINTVSAEVDVLQALALVRRLSVNVTPVGSPASTAEGDLMSYVLPANTLDVNGKGVRITAVGTGVSTPDATTVRCYFGGDVVVSKVLQASQANTWRAVFEVFRRGASLSSAGGTIENGGAAASIATAAVLSGANLAAAVTIKVTGQRAVSSVANSIEQLHMLVELIP